MKGFRFESATILRSLVHTPSQRLQARLEMLPRSRCLKLPKKDRSSARRKELGLSSLPSWLISDESAHTSTNGKAAEYTTNSPLQYSGCRSAASRSKLFHFMRHCRIWLLPSAWEGLQPQVCRFTSHLCGVISRTTPLKSFTRVRRIHPELRFIIHKYSAQW